MKKILKNEVIIHSQHICDNINKIKSYIGDTEIIAVIKGDGYGHGLLESAKACRKANVTTFALGDIKEANLLRKNGFDQNLLLLFPPNIDNIDDISNLNLIPTVYKIEHLKLISRTNKDIKFDLEINTGIGRSGCDISNVEIIMQYIKDNSLNIRYAYTHLYDNADYISSVKQLEQFKEAMRNYPDVLLHIGGSYAFCHGKEFFLDGLRVGLGLYGLIDMFLLEDELKLAMEFNTFFEDIIYLKKGQHLGYSSGFIAKRDSKIGLLNLGYAYGYPKTSKGFVKFDEEFCPIVGGVNMTSFCVDVTDVNEKYIKDYNKYSVNIFSINTADKNAIMSLANLNGIIPNLYVCGINKHYIDFKYI